MLIMATKLVGKSKALWKQAWLQEMAGGCGIAGTPVTL
jgi:hypothetical protein